MNKGVLLFLSIFIVFAYEQKINKETNEKQPVQVEKYDVIRCTINNNDPKKIGLKLYPDDEGVGVKSIWLEYPELYIVDTYHSNIKRINLISKKIKSSEVFSTKSRLWLRDLFVYNEKLYVLSDLDKNFILTVDLDLVDSFMLDRGVKYFVDNQDGGVVVTTNGKVFSKLDTNGKIVEEFQQDYINILNFAHGKKYDIVKNAENTVINTKDGSFNIKKEFPNLWKYYDGINIDFNNDVLVYFDIDENKNEYIFYVVPKAPTPK